jgi:hypothetical protein
VVCGRGCPLPQRRLSSHFRSLWCVPPPPPSPPPSPSPPLSPAASPSPSLQVTEARFRQRVFRSAKHTPLVPFFEVLIPMISQKCSAVRPCPSPFASPPSPRHPGHDSAKVCSGVRNTRLWCGPSPSLPSSPPPPTHRGHDSAKVCCGLANTRNGTTTYPNLETLIP